MIPSKTAWTICALALTVPLTAGSGAAEPSPNEQRLSLTLAAALRQADADSVQRILTDNPTQINARDERAWTPLMHAAFYADQRCVQLLLDQGADVRAANPAGATALHYATHDLAKVRLLLEAGADVNARTKLGNTPLILAARNSTSAPIVRMLLDKGADVAARNVYGVSALIVASSTDDAETVQLLLERKADPSVTPYPPPLIVDGHPVDVIFGGGQSALGWAARTGNTRIATLLLDAGADVNGQSLFGSPLFSAAQKNQVEVSRVLLDRGARVEPTVSDGQWTPLMWAASNERGNADLVELLLERQAQVNARSGDGWGPLMSAPQSPLTISLRRGPTDAVAALRRAGARQSPDPWAAKAVTPPQRQVTADSVDTKSVMAALTAAVPILERTAIESQKEFVQHGQNCISCHNQLLPLMAVSLARQKGIPHDPKTVRAIVQLLQGDASATQSINLEPTFHPSVGTFSGYFLWGLESESVAPDLDLDATVHALTTYQQDDGSWLQYFPRPPITDGEIGSTALAVRALTLYLLPGRRQEFDSRVARARQWLRQSVPHATEDHVYKLLGLYWADEPREQLLPLAQPLIELQREDGGWSQLPHLPSDAYATGQAVYALQQAAGRPATDSVIRRAIAYLVRTQLEDGSWFARRRAFPFQPTMQPMFPHGRDGWISTAATSWAVMGLSVGLDKQQVQRSLDDLPATVRTVPESSAKLPDPADRQVHYETDIRPILESSCLDCHNAEDSAGGYAMNTHARFLRGGISGPPVVVTGNSAASLLIQHVAGLIEDVEMPPPARRDEYQPLTAEQIGLLRAWIDQGLPGLVEG